MLDETDGKSLMTWLMKLIARNMKVEANSWTTSYINLTTVTTRINLVDRARIEPMPSSSRGTQHTVYGHLMTHSMGLLC